MAAAAVATGISTSKQIMCGRDDVVCVRNTESLYKIGQFVPCWYDATQARLSLSEPMFWNMIWIIIFMVIGIILSLASVIALLQKGVLNSFYTKKPGYGSV